MKDNGFEIVENDPEFVISYGGDGTLMRSEQAYPGTPKILLKNSAICKKCSQLSNKEVLEKVRSGSYAIEKLIKLEVEARGKSLTALNDVIIHNKDPRNAIRYNISVNSKPFAKEIIGDGIVVATPFGSTGYYRSITDSFFEIGIGLAFNNSIEQSDHMVLKEDAVIELTVTRGPAEVYADNNELFIELNPGDKVTVRKSSEFAEIICPK